MRQPHVILQKHLLKKIGIPGLYDLLAESGYPYSEEKIARALCGFVDLDTELAFAIATALELEHEEMKELALAHLLRFRLPGTLSHGEGSQAVAGPL